MDQQLQESGLQVRWHNMTYICLFREEQRDSGGILFGDNPLKHSFPVFLALVALSQITIRVIYFLLKPLRQPKFVCSLLGGIFLGPSILGRSKSYMRTMFSTREQILLDVTSNLGVIYFLFLTMAKMDTPLIVRSSKSAWIIGIASMALPLFINGSIFGLSSHLFSQMHGHAPSMVMSFTLSHFPNVAHALEELNLLSSELGQLALTASAVNEILAWVGVLYGMVVHTGDLLLSFWIFLSAMFIICFNFFGVRRFLFWVASRTPEGKAVDEIYITGILLGALVMAFMSDSIGMVLAGAIILGIAIPNGPSLAATLVDKSEVFIMEFLMPQFYLTVGLQINIPEVKDWRNSITFFLLTILTTLMKLMGALLPAAIYYKIKVRHAFVLGLLLNVRGVIELITVRRWKDSEDIDEECYTVMVLANLVITAVMVPLVECLYKPQDNDSALPANVLTAIQKSSYNAELRVLTCIHGEKNVNGIITILEASNPTAGSPVRTIVAHLIELAGRAAPIVVPYRENRKMIGSQSSDRITGAFDSYSRSSDGTVTVKPFIIIAPYKIMHENICKLARDEAAHLIIIPFRKMQEDDAGAFTFLRSLNTNLQASAQCTVGILVDKGFPSCTRHAKFSCNVAVIFLGGPDDREALAFATRISGHAGIRMTMIHILLLNQGGDQGSDQGQKKIDDSILGEFKMKNMKNPCAVYHALMARDGIQVVNIIKLLRLDYDLVILGHQPVKGVFSEVMINLVENPELGVIGDILVTEGFCGRSTSVLVMKHHSFM